MRRVFVDTAALIALGNRRDQWHAQAVSISRQLTLAGFRFVTTDAVLLEVGNTFSRAAFKPVALRLIQTVRESTRWHCVASNRELVDRGFDLFQQMADKDWSLTDCISMIVAKDQGLQQIFTTDHHFTQAGFEILLQVP